MKLLLDIGNSYLKYSLTENGTLGKIESLAITHKLADTLAILKEIATPSEVIFASSNKSISLKNTEQLLNKLFAKPVTAITSQASFKDLRNGYDKPEQLGVDRWLGMIYAWDYFKDACCLIDCGTCMTYDEINADAQHLGGLILPGRLMGQMALTTLISPPPLSHQRLTNYTSTSSQEAINSGANIAFIATVQELIKNFQTKYPDNQNILITGGDAQFISSKISDKTTVKENISLKVLLGFANSSKNG